MPMQLTRERPSSWQMLIKLWKQGPVLLLECMQLWQTMLQKRGTFFITFKLSLKSYISIQFCIVDWIVVSRLFFTFYISFKNYPLPYVHVTWRDSISRPITPISWVACGDDNAGPRRQSLGDEQIVSINCIFCYSANGGKYISIINSIYLDQNQYSD
jgi:hypothetical protein